MYFLYGCGPKKDANFENFPYSTLIETVTGPILDPFKKALKRYPNEALGLVKCPLNPKPYNLITR